MLQAYAKVLLERKRAENVFTRYMELICRLDTSRVQVYSDAAIPLWGSELRPNSVLFLPILILPYQQQDRLEEVLETGDKVARFGRYKGAAHRLRKKSFRAVRVDSCNRRRRRTRWMSCSMILLVEQVTSGALWSPEVIGLQMTWGNCTELAGHG